jgi:hypothetical protein
MILFVMLSSMLYTRYYSPMSRSSRESSNRINPSVLVFPLIVGLIGWFVMSKTTPVVPSNTPTAPPSLSSTSSSMTVLLGRARQDAKQDELFVYDVDAGRLMSTTTANGWRLPLSSMVSVTRRSEDSVWLLQGSEWSVSLRNTRGHAYQDPLYVGSFDETHFAIAAIDSDRRVLVSVSKAGVIREVAVLSEQTVPLTIQHGKVWLVESAPREGIEVPPHGPSRVWSVTMEGSTSTVVVDERTNALVTDVVAQGADIALVSDQNDFRLLGPTGLSRPVTGKPLGWLPDHRLLLVQGGKLCLESDGVVPVCGPLVPEDIRFLRVTP